MPQDKTNKAAAPSNEVTSQIRQVVDVGQVPSQGFLDDLVSMVSRGMDGVGDTVEGIIDAGRGFISWLDDITFDLDNSLDDAQKDAIRNAPQEEFVPAFLQNIRDTAPDNAGKRGTGRVAGPSRIKVTPENIYKYFPNRMFVPQDGQAATTETTEMGREQGNPGEQAVPKMAPDGGQPPMPDTVTTTGETVQTVPVEATPSEEPAQLQPTNQPQQPESLQQPETPVEDTGQGGVSKRVEVPIQRVSPTVTAPIQQGQASMEDTPNTVSSTITAPIQRVSRAVEAPIRKISGRVSAPIQEDMMGTSAGDTVPRPPRKPEVQKTVAAAPAQEQPAVEAVAAEAPEVIESRQEAVKGGSQVDPIKVAAKYMGLDERDKTQQNTIKGFFDEAVPGWVKDPSSVTSSKYAWCAAFASHVLTNLGVDTGLTGFDRIRARKYAGIGNPVASYEDAKPGDLVVRTPSASGASHVGFFVGRQGDKILVLGGNQNNRVNVTAYDPSKFPTIRRIPDLATVDEAQIAELTADIQQTGSMR